MASHTESAASLRSATRQPNARSTFFGRLVGYVYDLIEAAAKLPADGAAKKAWVLAKLRDALDRYLPLLPLPWWLAPVAPFIRRTIKSATLAVADVAIEQIYRRVKPYLPKPEPKSTSP